MSIAIWNDIDTDFDDEFNEWHTREHMPERVSIPGFLRGRRYEAIDADIAYFTYYELAGPEVLTGGDYRAKLDAPTDWSLKATQRFRNNIRGVCDDLLVTGVQQGGHLVTARIDLEPGTAPSPAATDRLAALTEVPGVAGVRLIRCNPELSGTRTALQKSRQIALPETAVFLDCYRRERAGDVAKLLTDTVAEVFPDRPAVVGTYQLQCELTGS
ncbi:hypothetical protein WIS52_25385 [Pseudonocardia nematodicida]|uniref:Uncharacterized protein n=1 Tax=Pseudonocardia nematodicida TaxID=1206997 RepID=A0ABV1KJQ8_9PSEU